MRQTAIASKVRGGRLRRRRCVFAAPAIAVSKGDESSSTSTPKYRGGRERAAGHLTQRRERPSPWHAYARRKLGLKVGQSLLQAGYLRVNKYKP
jgi:hypothetical protein